MHFQRRILTQSHDGEHVTVRTTEARENSVRRSRGKLVLSVRIDGTRTDTHRPLPAARAVPTLTGEMEASFETVRLSL